MRSNHFLKTFLTYCLLMGIYIMQAQTKAPAFFRWQNKIASKSINKFLNHDTLIATSQATMHVTYSNQANKPYLMLVHGLGLNARTNWYKQIKSLSKHYNLIVPDLVYFGESKSNSNNFTIDFQVEQLNELLTKLNISQPINLLGFSYGGLTVALFNEKYHNRVNKLIIADGPVKFFSDVEADSLAKLVGMQNMFQIITPATPVEYEATEMAALSSSLPTSNKLKRKIIGYLFDPTRQYRTNQMQSMRDYQKQYQGYNYNLDKTQTLLIWGAKDGVVPLSVGERLHKAFPATTKLIIYPNAKHDAHFSYTKHFNKAVIEFLK